MKRRSPCSDCKYYVSKVSIYYHGVVEGCSRQDWKEIRKNKQGLNMRNECYVPVEKEGDNK